MLASAPSFLRKIYNAHKGFSQPKDYALEDALIMAVRSRLSKRCRKRSAQSASAGSTQTNSDSFVRKERHVRLENFIQLPICSTSGSFDHRSSIAFQRNQALLGCA